MVSQCGASSIFHTDLRSAGAVGEVVESQGQTSEGEGILRAVCGCCHRNRSRKLCEAGTVDRPYPLTKQPWSAFSLN
jgi:hypothetical protein